jgi:hypothetical protein
VAAMASLAPASFCVHSATDRSLRTPSLLVKGPRLRCFGYKVERWGGGRGRRRGCCVARISETDEAAVEQGEAHAREDERTGAGGYKLKETPLQTQPVHLEMETVGDVERPKRIAFNYGFQAKFLRAGASVPGNVVKLALENFGREWRVISRPHLF